MSLSMARVEEALKTFCKQSDNQKVDHKKNFAGLVRVIESDGWKLQEDKQQ